VVRVYGKRANDLDQKLPDPILDEIKRLNKRIITLENALHIQSCKYSISDEETTEDDEL
jgi:hypothetical protein